MVWLLFILCIAIALFIWFIIFSGDKLETEKTLHGSTYVKANNKEKFILNYQWCVENLTLNYKNLFIDYEQYLDDSRRFDYFIVYKLSNYQATYSFKELGNLNVKVTNGAGYDCGNVNAFYNKFNSKVEAIRKLLDQQDMILYKKYKINYTNLLTNILKNK
ncbi:hypothetical protein Phab24_id092 [Acinetobacter phage Phab24]|nr:hypothetical protein Phab24_id092 [Acinetobacter phage Phab24]